MSKEGAIIGDMRILKGMRDAGLIVFDKATGEMVGHWTGATVKAVYVDDVAPGIEQPFTYKGKQYRLKYFDGCFCPFVCREGAQVPSFV